MSKKPLQLKGILVRHGISLRELQRLLIEREIDISHESLNRISKGYILTRKNHNKICNGIEEVLSSIGITIKDLWGEAREEKEEVKIMLTSQALQHFNLSEDPFSQEPESKEDIFINEDLGQAKNAILYAVEKQRMVAIVAKWGGGKTTILDQVKEELADNENVILSEALVPDKDRVRTVDVVDSLILDLSLETENPKRSYNARARQLRRLVEQQAKQGKKIVVIIDDAHDLHLQTIIALRRMRDIHKMGMKRVISIIFLGQPKLKALLDKSPEIGSRVPMLVIESLNGRAAQYLEFKLKQIGREELFTKGALNAINRRRGDCETPLQINNFAVDCVNYAAKKGFTEITEEVINFIK